MKISSDFAILDVKNGRRALFEHFKPRPRLGPCPEELRIPVTITGYIGDVWSKDDGTSQEFEVQVDSVHLANIEAEPDPKPRYTTKRLHDEMARVKDQLIKSVWAELGAALAGADHSAISPLARIVIRNAVETATGTRAP